MNGLLLAAGLGTRFLPFTNILPKPAIPLLNVPLAYYNLHLIQQLRLKNLVVNLHHHPEVVKKIFSDTEKIGMEVSFSDETEQILGTGGAIRQARPLLEGSGTFVVANADVVNGFSIRNALDFHRTRKPLATMVVMKHPLVGTKYGAVWVNKNREVVGISKDRPLAECEPYHFVGIHFIEEKIFDYMPLGPCDVNRDIYLEAIGKGEKVLAFEKKGLWYDAGSLEDFLGATAGLLDILPRLQHQPYFLSLFRRFWPGFDRRPNIWEGENCDHLLDLGSTSKTLMDRNCHIHSSTRVNGFAVFGEGVIVDKNVELENVVVGAGVHIKENQSLSNTLILE